MYRNKISYRKILSLKFCVINLFYLYGFLDLINDSNLTSFNHLRLSLSI